MKHTLLSLVSLGLLALLPAPARATSCGNITLQGICQDHKTLVICQGEQTKVIACPQNEVCVSSHANYGGAAGCLPSELTDCQGVTALGTCAGNSLLHCEQNRLIEMPCPGSTTCIDGNASGSAPTCGYAAEPSLPTDNGAPYPEEEGLEGTDSPKEDYGNTDTEVPPPAPDLETGTLDDFDGEVLACGAAPSALWLWGPLLLLWRRRHQA